MIPVRTAGHRSRPDRTPVRLPLALTERPIGLGVNAQPFPALTERPIGLGVNAQPFLGGDEEAVRTRSCRPAFPGGERWEHGSAMGIEGSLRKARGGMERPGRMGSARLGRPTMIEPSSHRRGQSGSVPAQQDSLEPSIGREAIHPARSSTMANVAVVDPRRYALRRRHASCQCQAGRTTDPVIPSEPSSGRRAPRGVLCRGQHGRCRNPAAVQPISQVRWPSRPLQEPGNP
jgi:hypothetical protein